VNATDSVFSVNVFPDAHACDAVSATDHRNVPAVEASNTAMWLIVSDVPPFVHGPIDAEMAFDPDEAAFQFAAVA
jgi:hypothetical protein